MAFVSDKSGQNDVYARPFPGPGAEVTVSVGGGGEPVWAPSGRDLFYRHEGDLMSVSVEGTGTGLTIGAPRRLFADPYRRDTAGTLGGVANYGVSGSGDSFVMVEDVVPVVGEVGDGARLHVVLNWFEELVARVPN